jgi:hypothetical protein
MTTRVGSRGGRRRINSYRGVERVLGESVQLDDTSIKRFPARLLARNAAGDPGKEAHLAHLFIDRNRKTLGQFKIEASVDYDGKDVFVVFESGASIGAFGLISPLSGKPEVSVIVRPRFGWAGLGTSLGISGFKVIPEVLPLGLLPKTEREIPPWVLSATVVPRLRAMIQRLSRRFEMVEEVRSAPCGTVDWTTYASKMLPAMKLLEVPCRHPDLVSNTELRAAIHFTLRKQLSSLETQRTAGGVVFELIRMCTELLRAVDDVTPRAPTSRQLESWFKTPLVTTHLLQGLNAIEWTRDETGLGGVTDWRGLPWAMSMEQFYEAWVETIFTQFARRFGGHLRVGRRKETITPIAWERAYLGSQKFLLPDIVIEQDHRTIYVDAKYKKHFDEIRERGWTRLETEIQERHREDLLQVLAYSTLSGAKATAACLVYPCSPDTWVALKGRKQLSYRGSIYAGERKIELLLIAIPMGNRPEELVEHLGAAFAE